MHIFKQLIIITLMSTAASRVFPALKSQTSDIEVTQGHKHVNQPADVCIRSWIGLIDHLNHRYPTYSSKFNIIASQSFMALAMATFTLPMARGIMGLHENLKSDRCPLSLKSFYDFSDERCMQKQADFLAQTGVLGCVLASSAVLACIGTAIAAPTLLALGHQTTKDFLAILRAYMQKREKKDIPDKTELEDSVISTPSAIELTPKSINNLLDASEDCASIQKAETRFK